MVYFSLVGVTVTWGGAVILAIVTGVTSWQGLGNESPMTISDCTSNYSSAKFQAQVEMLMATFILILIEIVCLTIAMVMCILWVARVCQGTLPVTAIDRVTKVALYLLVNISLLCSLPGLGYFVAFESELNNCTISYEID